MSETAASACHTEHALLVLLGQYAQHLDLIKTLMAVPMYDRRRGAFRVLPHHLRRYKHGQRDDFGPDAPRYHAQ